MASVVPTVANLRRSFPHIVVRADEALEGTKKKRQFEYMLFGIGHFYYPNSRYSVGIQVVDRLAKFHQLEWKVKEELAAFVAEGKNFLLIKPRTNGPLNNYKSLRACLRHYTEISPDQDLFICHHDISQEIGSMHVDRSHWGKNNAKRHQHEPLVQIEEHTRLVDYYRVAIGISPPKEESIYPTVTNLFNGMHEARMQTTYICNKFPENQVNVLESSIFSDVGVLTKKIFSRMPVDPVYKSDSLKEKTLDFADDLDSDLTNDVVEDFYRDKKPREQLAVRDPNNHILNEVLKDSHN